MPADGVNLEMETIEAGDASNGLICMPMYVWFEKKEEYTHVNWSTF